MESRMISITQRIAEELNVKTAQIDAAVALLDEGATVPFISRYRKEVVGGLVGAQIRTLEDRLHCLREMEERRAAILQSIHEQVKLTPALPHQINLADTKNRREDLYLPSKQTRRAKAAIPIAAGLEPLA